MCDIQHHFIWRKFSWLFTFILKVIFSKIIIVIGFQVLFHALLRKSFFFSFFVCIFLVIIFAMGKWEVITILFMISLNILYMKGWFYYIIRIRSIILMWILDYFMFSFEIFDFFFPKMLIKTSEIVW